MTPRHTPTQRVRLVFRIVAIAAVAAAVSQVALGGVVRVTGSGLGCPDWPLCHGRVIPPFDLATLIEYSHRLSASVLMLLVLASAALAWTFYRSDLRIVVSSALGVGLVVVAAALGGVTVLTELAWWGVLFHLGIAELAVACMVAVTVMGWNGEASREERREANGATDRLNALVLVTLIGTLVLILSGSYMVGYGAGSSCATWPLCRGALLPDGTAYTIHMAHRFLAVMVGALIAATVLLAWSRRALRPGLGWVSILLAVLFAGQIAVGAGTVWTGFASEMKAAHLTLATLVWAALAWLGTVVYSPQRFEIARLMTIRRRTLAVGRPGP